MENGWDELHNREENLENNIYALFAECQVVQSVLQRLMRCMMTLVK